MGRGSGGSHREKKGLASSPGLADFTNGLVNSVLKLREVFLGGGGGIQITEKTVINCAHPKKCKVTLGLVHAS